MSSVYKFLDYELYDPLTPEGRSRISFLSSVLLNILKEEVAREWEGKERVEVLDVCCGKGIGAAAAVEAIRQLGFEPRVTIVDSRREAVEFAESFLKNELGVEVSPYVMSAEEVVSLRKAFDLAIMAGFSSIHFDPWRMVKLIASISASLARHGVFILEEVDRLYRYLTKGVKEISIARVTRGKILLAIHEPGDYDPIRSLIKFTILDAVTGDSEELYLHPWSVGELAALLWIFFRDIKIVNEDGISYILGKGPREEIKAIDIATETPPIED